MWMLRSMKDVEFKLIFRPRPPIQPSLFQKIPKEHLLNQCSIQLPYHSCVQLSLSTLLLTTFQTYLKVLEGGKVFRKPESGWMASEQLQNMTLVVTHDTLTPEHPKQSSFNRSVAEPGKLPYPTSQTDRVLRTRLNALEGHVDRRRDVVLQLRC